MRRKQIISVCRHLYKKGLLVSSEGNVSAKIGSSKILITPSGKRKGFLTDLVVVSLGEKRTPPGASVEYPLHREIYRVRSDVRCVIHAHPPFAIACSLAGVSLRRPFLAETSIAFGTIPTLPYRTPSTVALAKGLGRSIRNHSAVVLGKHGAVTVGATLEEALDRMEQLEQVAKIACLAQLMGRLPWLNKKELKALEKIRQRL
ncbi:MAG: class II aldolase/adducin family protein [Deltaproteobacteria bacterium]|nr:class II aldolase/adducin family protein [Deltaproteobacteria bacterium]